MPLVLLRILLRRILLLLPLLWMLLCLDDVGLAELCTGQEDLIDQFRSLPQVADEEFHLVEDE